VLSDTAISLDNGILVDEYCQTSVPDVYAAGDVANLLHPVFGRVRVEHFNNAEKQGRAVAYTLLGRPEPYDYIYSFWSDQYEHKLEYVGFARSWDQTVVRGRLESQRFLIFYLENGRIQAVFGLNRGGDPESEADSELRACQELIRSRAKPPSHALADESVDLWSLEGAGRR
jgi:3-phenylpropionate/trans-cinnamate dioxygenase ferredoxin reductase subunit